MLASRPCTLRKSLSHCYYPLLASNNSVSFHTSATRWPRVRPRAAIAAAAAARPSRPDENLQQVIQELQLNKAASHKKEPLNQHQHQQQPQFKDSASKINDPPFQQNEPPAPSPNSPSPLRQPSKRSAPPGLKPHKQSLFTHDTIRQGADSAALITSTTKAEHQKIVAAGTFFEHESLFLYSAETLYHHPKNEQIPEIVVLGASNVGKSSFLNALIGKTDAARVSARPGKTTLMNAFGVGPFPKIPKGLVRKGEKMPRHSLVVVDTPGYGFRSQVKWGESIMKYIKVRKTLRGAVVLLSSEKKLLQQDEWVLRSLAEANTRTLVVLTKADKAEGSWTEHCSEMAHLLRRKLKLMEKNTGNDWKEGSGWNPDLYITAAGMDRIPKLGSGGGIGSVRAAILEMAGFKLDDKEVKKQDETVKYGGPVVSFENIKWKK